MYKDKDKQREANAERQRRYKAKQKALLSEGVTDKALPDDIVKSYCEFVESILPKRGKDIKCFADLPPDVQEAMTEGGLTNVTDQDSRQIEKDMVAIGLRPVTGKPGDADYNGICTDEWRAERGR
jgi:hypothetical protein